MLSCKAAPAPAERPSRLVSSRDSAAVFGTALKTSANAKTSEPVCGTALYAMLRVPGGHLAAGRRPGARRPGARLEIQPYGQPGSLRSRFRPVANTRACPCVCVAEKFILEKFTALVSALRCV